MKSMYFSFFSVGFLSLACDSKSKREEVLKGSSIAQEEAASSHQGARHASGNPSTIAFDSRLYSDPYLFEKTRSTRAMLMDLLPQNKNFVYSPLSLDGALMLLGLAASGETLVELARFLQVSSREVFNELARVEQSVRRITAASSGDGSPAIVDFGSAILSHKKFKLNEAKIREFGEQVELFVRAYDFADDAPRAVLDINSWVADKTKKRIQNLLESIDPQTRMILVNALYMKVAWQEPFSKGATSEQLFYAANGVSRRVSTMTRSEHMPYVDHPQFEAVSLGLQSQDLEMWLAKPKQNVSKFFTLLRSSGIKDLVSKAKARKIELHLPRFKIENKISMLAELKKNGLSRIGEARGELAQLFQNPQDLFVSEVLQGNFFALDENGIEAAAATAIMMKATAIPRPETPYVLKFDRPFVFLVYHKMSGRIAFVGQVFEPQVSP